MKRVLFVCTGNTCRSPMAEAIFNHLSNDAFLADSAGLATTQGRSVSENSLLALKELGIHTNHKSQPVTKELLEQQDYIIGITSNHTRILSQCFPEFSEKTFAFPAEISDPYGRDLEAYRKCRDNIERGVKSILSEIESANKYNDR